MKALIHENTHLALDPLLNWQPVPLVVNISSDAVKLPLVQNDPCGGYEHVLQQSDVTGTCTIDDTVAVVDPTTDKCVDHGLGGFYCK